jgi:hypothetical protein
MGNFEITGVDRAAGGSEAEVDGWGALAATLQRPEAGNGASQREDGSHWLREAAERPAAPIDPGTLATLVGEEVASVLKAAQVAAGEIRSKAEDLAADAQRRISEMQSALAHMSDEMADLMTRTVERAPSVPRADRTEDSATSVDEPIVIEHRSGTGTPTRGSDPDVGYRPGDYQRWLQRMGELSSQEPR